MNKLIALAGILVLVISPVLLAQDVMQYGVKHLKVLAEDDRVKSAQTRTENG